MKFNKDLILPQFKFWNLLITGIFISKKQFNFFLLKYLPNIKVISQSHIGNGQLPLLQVI